MATCLRASLGGGAGSSTVRRAFDVASTNQLRLRRSRPVSPGGERPPSKSMPGTCAHRRATGRTRPRVSRTPLRRRRGTGCRRSPAPMYALGGGHCPRWALRSLRVRASTAPPRARCTCPVDDHPRSERRSGRRQRTGGRAALAAAALHLLDGVSLRPERSNVLAVRIRAAQLAVVVRTRARRRTANSSTVSHCRASRSASLTTGTVGLRPARTGRSSRGLWMRPLVHRPRSSSTRPLAFSS